jgi:hypothetical protein
MEKAYDVAVLLAQLKGRGLDVAEEAAKVLIEEMFGWVEASAKVSATPYDDMALIVLPQLKAFALATADKIDSQVG